jgi:hypothetical protein
MKADTAERLTELALQMSDDLNGMVRDIEATESDEETVRLREAIGRVMWAIYFEILKPTYEEHPCGHASHEDHDDECASSAHYRWTACAELEARERVGESEGRSPDRRE